MDRNSQLRIIVLGYLIRGPLGGMAWSPLQYVLGLSRLGHDVYYVEDSDDYPSCYNPVRQCTDADPAYGLQFAHAAFERLGLRDRWAYYDAHTAEWFGPAGTRMPPLCRDADVVINVTALNPLRPWTEDIPVRILIDGESVFTQIRHLTKPGDRREAEKHTHFFTLAENFGKAGCTVPNDGFPWQPTRHPVTVDAWPVTPGNPGGKFTSVFNWESIPPCEYGGVKYGMKSAAYVDYLTLPTLVRESFELAVGSPNAPREDLRALGWAVLDPEQLSQVTRDPWTYQTYIQQSKGEFGINRHGFVVTQSGWFSERSANYLAAGRPVLTLDTGVGAILPTGAGLFPFSSIEDVGKAIDTINTNYAFHCRKAREVAEEYFDARKILCALLSAVFS